MQSNLIYIIGFAGWLFVLGGVYFFARLFTKRNDRAFLAATAFVIVSSLALLLLFPNA